MREISFDANLNTMTKVSKMIKEKKKKSKFLMLPFNHLKRSHFKAQDYQKAKRKTGGFLLDILHKWVCFYSSCQFIF